VHVAGLSDCACLGELDVQVKLKKLSAGVGTAGVARLGLRTCVAVGHDDEGVAQQRRVAKACLSRCGCERSRRGGTGLDGARSHRRRVAGQIRGHASRLRPTPVCGPVVLGFIRTTAQVHVSRMIALLSYVLLWTGSVQPHVLRRMSSSPGGVTCECRVASDPSDTHDQLFLNLTARGLATHHEHGG
jgi:hypothetical protein